MTNARSLMPLLLVPVLAFGACSGSEDSSDAGSAAPAAVDGGPEMAVGDLSDGLDAGAVALDEPRAGSAADREARGGEGYVAEKAIISTGNVALLSDDVEQSGFEAQQVVDQYRGEVTEQTTRTDDDGEVRSVRMVIRVPAEHFADAYQELQEVADLERSSSSSEDVTTQVIDVQVRIRAQRRSLQRVEELLDRATSIGDIVRIESELTRRQADLDSLEQQQAYLADQTSKSTITLTVQRTDAEPAPEPEEARGFLGGLADGWHALVAVAVAAATVAGWALPFAVVLLLVGVPVLLVRRRRRPATT
ncbi:DUF4349 domain-containing protein [Nocardioides sp. GY 10113]|uniref:DUF4349 domain-containing protein n=1 Tax=Nocardioides sp. GY 10113 TaxID=2569761 RepID=UPI0010A75529|nr:DUF4349 domain-containing protein [Nocardioides sp. GY 10113]TIC85935.1 DUF4349 domain-containing protein [Nocardioides sp. GY 10113]